MKGILSFKLPEENEEFIVAQNGSALAAAIHEFDQNLRSSIKYKSEELSEMEIKILEKVRRDLWQSLQNYGVNDLI